MDDKNQFNDTFIIPHNAVKVNELLGVPWTRWLETAVFVLITTIIIMAIPFVPKVKIIFLVVMDISVGAVTLHGIHGRTLTSVLYYFIANRVKRVEYHLGSIYDDRKAADAAKFAGKSGIEKLIERIKSVDSKLEERYGHGETESIQEDEDNE